MREHQKPNLSTVLASATSGLIELLTFHPLDTLTKRIINNRESIFVTQTRNPFNNLQKVVFREHVNASYAKRYLSLFPGLRYAIVYKQFGGHPFMSEYIRANHFDTISYIFGQKNAKLWNNAIAGAIIGVGEVIFLPLDLLKVQGQTSHSGASASTIVSHFHNQPLAAIRTLYRGSGWTAARNSIGCFALFGTSAYIKQNFFALNDIHLAKLHQDVLASLLAASTCILMSAPFDVVKVRIQASKIGSSQSGIQILRALIQREGMLALFKGLVPKLLIAGPKIAFGFTLSQQLAQLFNK